MTDYGGSSSTHGIVLSTLNTSNVPAGDRIYLVSPEFGGTESFQSKITDLAGGLSFGMRDGKRSVSITIQDCYIKDYLGGSKNTLVFSEIHNVLKKWHRSGEDPIFIWFYNFADGEYVDVGMDASGNALPYLEGYVQSYS